MSYDYPSVVIRTHVSSGTYIRSLVEDIGNTLGVGAYCTELRRIAIADWSVDQAKMLQDFGITS
jgi:tRNA pseudouridine55 synthase